MISNIVSISSKNEKWVRNFTVRTYCLPLGFPLSLASWTK